MQANNPSKKRVLYAHELPKRILWSFKCLLSTKIQTDTVDRLFESQHVNDIRLITAAAFLAFSFVTLFSAIFGILVGVSDIDSSSYQTTLQHIVRGIKAGGTPILKIFATTCAIFAA